MPQELVYTIAQIIGYIAMVLAVVSMQFKSMRVFYTIQTVAAGIFVVSYIMLGAYASAILNTWGVFASLLLLIDKRTRATGQLFVLLVVLALCGGLSLWIDGTRAILPLIAQIGAAIGMWSRNAAKLRLLRLTLASPLWLINNILIRSGGGIACEAFYILSVLVSIWRYGWRTLMQEEDTGGKEDRIRGTSE